MKLTRQPLSPLVPLLPLLALCEVSPAQVDAPDLYDPTVLRTLELTFASPTFFADIDRISSTTVDGQVTADLTVDGVLYPGVGVRFRGNTSQRSAGQKRSFKISIDHTDPEQRLYGYRTLKLNNAASDPTFLREVLYSRIGHEYYPSPTANHVRLTLNGQDWGVYANVQFYNKDFLAQWFDRTGGNRFKAPSGGGTGPGGGGPRCNVGGGIFACGDRALMWLGPTLSEYSSRYELNSDEEPDPWSDLMRFCDDFNNTAAADFESLAPELLDVDAALWMLALENIFADHDGYLEKGADYAIYQQPDGGRLHLVQHDANECFQSTSWGLFPSLTNDQRPVVKRLLAVSRFKARYVAHVRTVDAIHLACARENGFKEVYTNDRHMLASAPLFELTGINVIG
jgi:spore coat protein CotH